MSVLQRKELEESPLADLHAIASELGLEGFRAMRREDLIAAILEAQGGEVQESPPEEPAEEEEPEYSLGPAARPADEEGAPPGAEEEAEAHEEPAVAAIEEEAAEEPAEAAEEPEPAEEPAEPAEPERLATGTLDVLPGGSGFVRVAPGEPSADDVYVSPAQIRRCELRAGDEVSGPVRPPRRSERHPSLVRVESVNGAPAEPPESRPHFSELTPAFASDRLAAPPALEGAPFGKGSRVAIGGPPGAGATTLLREIVQVLADGHPELKLQVVLAGVRPEEVTEWRRSGEVPVAGGSFDASVETQAQAAELAVERAKRSVERGGDAAVVIDSLEALPPAVARRVFGAARRAEEGGSLTVIASTGMAWEAQRWATTRVMLDPPASGGGVNVSAGRSSSLRADLLG